MQVFNVSANRSLYSRLEQLTGQISLLKGGWTFPGDGVNPPLVMSRNIASDGKRFLRIKLSRRVTDTKGTPAYKGFVTLDLDRRFRLAWIVTDKHKPFTTPQLGVLSNHNRALWFIAKRLQPLLNLAQQGRDKSRIPLKAKSPEEKSAWRQHLTETFNLPPDHEARVRAVKEKNRQERERLKRESPTTLPNEVPAHLSDLLHRKSLYQRLTSLFGDLRDATSGSRLRGEPTGVPHAQDLIFEGGPKTDRKGLFALYTQSPGNSGSRTLVAYFLVDFVTMQAQATPALALLKAGYTLGLRAPEHMKDMKLYSHLGNLLPLGVSDPGAREKAYSSMLSYAGVSAERFQAVPRRFISSGDRLGLYCNLAADGMLGQLESAGYELPTKSRQQVQGQGRSQEIEIKDVTKDGPAEAVTVRFEDGSEETLMVTEGGQGRRSTKEVLEEYVRQRINQQEPDVGASRKSFPKLRHSY